MPRKRNGIAAKIKGNFRKNYKNRFKSNGNKSQKKIPPFGQNENFQKFKHIQRGKDADDLLRQQKKLHSSIRQQTRDVLSSDSEQEDNEVNVMDQLVLSFQTKRNDRLNDGRLTSVKRKAIDSSESSSSEEDTSNTESMESDTSHENDSIETGKDEINLDNHNAIDKLDTSFNDGDNDNEENLGEFDAELDNVTSSDELKDIFSVHLDNLLSSDMLECVSKGDSIKAERLDWPKLGRLCIQIAKSTHLKTNRSTLLDNDVVYASEGTIPKKLDYKKIIPANLHIKTQLQMHWNEANKINCENLGKTKNVNLTPVQAEIFSIVNNYQDFYYPHRNLQNGDEIRFIYCLHTLNHILKTRAKILHHNAKLDRAKLNNGKKIDIIPDSYRDHGLFRPKVLIILPFKDAALRVVNTLVSLIFPQLGETVMNYKKFTEEFTGESIHFPKTNPKPEDYELTFAGNTDDMFRIGLCLTRKCLKLYTGFYASDIIIASPLGLRTIVGASGEKDRDYDFLATIELLIIDQADVVMAQNWDHLIHVLEHFHLQPQSSRDTDLSRVRPWCLNGWAKFYRQTLLFASHDTPMFRSLFNRHCWNYRGKIRTVNPIASGSIRHVAVSVPQTFHRIEVTSIQSSFDQRFNYFINHILPQCKGPLMAHCLIYVPSYFDYVRIRNYFKKESINFVQICEYTKDTKIARARDMFFHSSAHFLLYSERAHFFRRTRLKGIRHLVMYQPPMWPHFYPEMINLMQDGNQNARDGGDTGSMSVTVLYTKYDLLSVASIVGTDQAEKMDASDKNTHMFMTGE